MCRQKESMSRRDFITHIVRLVLGSILGLFFFSLALKRGNSECSACRLKENCFKSGFYNGKK